MFEFDTSEIENKAKEAVKSGKDKGHMNLVHDVQDLYFLTVDEHAFHDFISEKYATPKLALMTRLEEMISKLKKGEYDN